MGCFEVSEFSEDAAEDVDAGHGEPITVLYVKNRFDDKKANSLHVQLTG
jgi:hypothetical protein